MTRLFTTGFLLWSIGCCSLSTTASESVRSLDAPSVGETLEDFLSAAIEYSPRLRIALENFNIGGARERQARAQLLPQVRANANLTDNRRNSLNLIGNPMLEEFEGERYSVTLTQALFNWQAWSARKRASFLEDRAEAEYFYELAFLLTDVADRYLNVLQSQDALTSIASELEAVSNQLDQIQSLYSLQLAQITDLRQAEASLTSVQAEQLRLQAELAINEEFLRSVTGIEIGRLNVLNREVTLPAADEDLQHWVELAEDNNQQIRAQRYALRAAEEFIAESKGAYMPQVNVIAQHLDSNIGFDNRFLGQTDTTFLGVDVSIPIFAGGANRARVSEARSQRSIAESELRQTELEANEQVRSAYLQVQSSALLTEAATRLVESTRLSSEAMQQGYELGTVTTVDVLNALRDQFQAERDLQSARYEHIKFLLLLKREAGVLDAQDMLEVGNWLVEPESNQESSDLGL
ncbi:MAG: TolC family outer membrane protein [Gammaproteobacteria bacterium]|nr:TolC family outer membrane protein [Gammaproteobacteria bacterium]